MPGLRPIERNGVYYAFGTVAGQRIRRSLGTRDKRQAQERCAQYEAKLWKSNAYGEDLVRTFEEATISYVNAGGEVTYLAPLLAHFRGRVLGTIKPEEVRQAARRLGAKSKASTQNRQVIVPVRAIINHASGLGWCPPIQVKSFPISKPKRTSVNREWISAFMAQADADGLPHLAAAVLFMWQTGTRVSETARVMPINVDLVHRKILLERTKTSVWEERHLSNELFLRVAHLKMNAGCPVFGYRDRFGISTRMKAVCRRAGIEYVPPHQAGRHSFASNALELGATVKEVMDAGGWKTARLVLETYAHTRRASQTIAERFDAELTRPVPPTTQAIGKKR